MSKPRPGLRIVRNGEPLYHGREKPCTWCALIVIFLLMGLVWWPIFKLIGAV